MERLGCGLAQATTSTLPEFRALAANLTQDRQAVAAILRLVRSNGRVEG